MEGIASEEGMELKLEYANNDWESVHYITFRNENNHRLLSTGANRKSRNNNPKEGNP